jgi:CHAT domain-containing protein
LLQELGTASHKPIYELYLDILLHLHEQEPEAGHDVRAFAVSERSRYRALMEMLHAARFPVEDFADREQLAQRAELNRRIDGALRRALTDPEGAEASGELSRLRLEYQRLQQEILDRNPHYRRLAESESLTVQDVQERVLDEGSVLLEYALGEERSFLWMIRRDDFRIVTLPGRERIEALAAQTYRLLTEPSTPQGGKKPQETLEWRRKAHEEYSRVAGELSRMILGPVLEDVGSRRILVAAEGELLYLPFAALPDPRHADSYTPLMVHNEVAHLPSASSVLQLRREPWHLPASPRITMVLDPVYRNTDERFEGVGFQPAPSPDTSAERDTRQAVPLETLSRLHGSAVEGRRILDLDFPARYTMLEGFDATVQNIFDATVKEAHLVHFAVHGLVGERHPELSGLALTRLAPDGQKLDGFLSLHDIYNLPLRAQLVTLSACNTALGKAVRGEGLIGLTRGFLYAGVPRVVASLWKVGDDETADLMERFYHHLLVKRRSPTGALRHAQIEMWQQQKHGEPSFGWAAFIVQGDWQ